MRHALFAALFFAASLPTSAKAADKPDRKGLDFFERRIRPVLVKHCYECHSAKSRKIRGGLRLDTRADIRKGGETGPGVVPGKPEKSVVIGALKHDDLEMPPKGKLPASVVADFVRWVKMGAPDPRDGKAKLAAAKVIDFTKARRFWSFRPLVKPAAPKVPGVTGDLSPIDRFVRAKLSAKGLPPAPRADKRTLIRRLSFDLIGLPPSPEDIDRFLKDDSPDAYEKLVDRLLASRHFGERWGRHWLDVARFAESSGGGRTHVYHLAWRYRDYVIAAFNADKPFDRFVREQIAGDLLPWKNVARRRSNLTATGFLMLGPTNYELQDKELLRMEVVDEQLDTLGRAFLGMTIGCARCHDHKFDPIPNADYYALAGILRSTHVLTPGNVSGYLKRPLPISAEHSRQLAAYERKATPLQDEIASLKEKLRRLRTNQSGLPGRAVKRESLAGIVVDDAQAAFTGKWASSSSIRSFVGTRYRYASGPNKTALFSVPVPRTGRYEVRISHSPHANRAAMAHVTVHHADGRTSKRIDQRKRPPIDGLFVSLGEFRFETGKPARVVLSTRAAHGTVIADAVQLLSERDRKRRAGKKPRKRRPKTKQAAVDLRAAIAAVSRRLTAAEAELKRLKTTAPAKAPLTMAVAEHKAAGDYFLCIRGNVHKLGKKVPRGFLRVLAGDKPPSIAKGHSGRLELANWLTSDSNPLTPRVAVNRVWHHLLGAGLVRTVDNFGLMGERPSHPELLDWLAATFQADGWSVKRMIRRIVLSETYRQSARFERRAAGIDPENRLLWRQNRRRLEAEPIRDAVLAVSGQLELTVGGKVIADTLKSEFGYKHSSRRRSVYVPALRNAVHPLLAVFDVADPNLVTGRRNNSTLATQALYLMNSPFVMEQSRRAASRLLKEKLPGETERLNRAYLRTLGRPPTQRERKLALSYLRSFKPAKPGGNARRQAWATLFQTLFASVDFRYVE
ncbi:MAG: DUF1553 domain-containing protein [Planctomycetaceae bacterium]